MIFVTVSTGHFDPLIEECERLRAQFDFEAQIGSSGVKPSFPYSKTLTPEELLRKMTAAELVVTHAGTGMLGMLYSLRKPCVVIPKQRRYGEANDGQIDLAIRWAELGMAVLCIDVQDLAKAIGECRSYRFSYPEFPSLGGRMRALFDV